MAEFPKVSLVSVAEYFDEMAPLFGDTCTVSAAVIRQAVKAHAELSDRCVMDRVSLSLEIANLRARLREVDPSFPGYVDPHQLTIEQP